MALDIRAKRQEQEEIRMDKQAHKFSQGYSQGYGKYQRLANMTPDQRREQIRKDFIADYIFNGRHFHKDADEN